MNVLDVFSGAGGFSLGFKMAGYEIVGAIEKVDQIYVLRKERNVDREFRLLPGFKSNPIFADVVWHLFSMVRDYLRTDWQGTVADGIERGYLIN